MNYIKEFEVELAKKLNGHEDIASVVRWVSGKILESFKHGIIAGRKRPAVNRKEQNSTGVSASKAE